MGTLEGKSVVLTGAWSGIGRAVVTRYVREGARVVAVDIDRDGLASLAAESGGNVEGSVPGEEVLVGGVTIWGARDVPSQLPVDASRLYSRNVADLLLLMTAEGVVAPDWEDEIVAACWVTREGAVREGVAV